jgi:uncharacterized repeat protein (TIGR03943 family)
MSPRALTLYLLPPLVLLTWGGVMLEMAASGRLRVFLNPLFWPLEILGGVMLLILALGYFLCFRPSLPEFDSGAYARRIGQVAVLIVPFLMSTLFAPSSFSAAALEARAGLAGARTLAQSSSGSSSANESPSMIDFVTASYYPEQIPKVQNRHVRYLGQFLPSDNAGEFRFCRVLMSCCAADATPIYIHIVGVAPAQISTLQWINVEGDTFFRKDDGEWTACLRLTGLTPAQPPPDPYLYAIRTSKVGP